MGIEKYVDRGMLKWQPASFIIEQKDLLDEAYRNFYKKPKPILDNDQNQLFYYHSYQLDNEYTK